MEELINKIMTEKTEDVSKELVSFLFSRYFSLARIKEVANEMNLICDMAIKNQENSIGSLSNGILIITKKDKKKRVSDKKFKTKEKELFKALLGEMIDLKYEEFNPEKIINVAIGALASFVEIYSIEI